MWYIFWKLWPTAIRLLFVFFRRVFLWSVRLTHFWSFASLFLSCNYWISIRIPSFVRLFLLLFPLFHIAEASCAGFMWRLLVVQQHGRLQLVPHQHWYYNVCHTNTGKECVILIATLADSLILEHSTLILVYRWCTSIPTTDKYWYTKSCPVQSGRSDGGGGTTSWGRPRPEGLDLEELARGVGSRKIGQEGFTWKIGPNDLFIFSLSFTCFYKPWIYSWVHA